MTEKKWEFVGIAAEPVTDPLSGCDEGWCISDADDKVAHWYSAGGSTTCGIKAETLAPIGHLVDIEDVPHCPQCARAIAKH